MDLFDEIYATRRTMMPLALCYSQTLYPVDLWARATKSPKPKVAAYSSEGYNSCD